MCINTAKKLTVHCTYNPKVTHLFCLEKDCARYPIIYMRTGSSKDVTGISSGNESEHKTRIKKGDGN